MEELGRLLSTRLSRFTSPKVNLSPTNRCSATIDSQENLGDIVCRQRLPSPECRSRSSRDMRVMQSIAVIVQIKIDNDDSEYRELPAKLSFRAERKMICHLKKL